MRTHLSFAIHLAQQAGELLLEQFDLFGTKASIKADFSVVTEADTAADRIITEGLTRQYPLEGLVSEELSPISPAKTQAVWVVDPLDGTTNFSLGLPFWGVSVARLVNGYPDSAALYFPILKEMYAAQRGEGAYLNEQKLQVRPLQENQTAAFFACCSRSHRRYQIGIRFKPRILGSAAYNLCAVARGTAVVGFEASPKIWDLAAGWLLIQEAGGVVEPLNGAAPFPIKPKTDYRTEDFPIITAASRDLADLAHQQIKLR
jgi:myo-inositol-1(or 4)-monophosphatase